MPETSPRRDAGRRAARIAGVYALFGGLWILFSDSLLAALVNDPATLTRFQMFKGWFYVALTAALIYALARNQLEALRRAESDRRASELRLDAVLAHAPLSVWSLDPGGVVSYCSGLGLEALGLAPEGALGRSFAGLFPGRADLAGLLARVLAGESFLGPLELAGRSLEVAWLPRVTLDGGPDGAVAVALDVTDLEWAEHELLARERMLEEARRLGRLGDWEYDPAGDRSVWSPEVFDLFGRDPALGPPGQAGVLEYYRPAEALRLHEGMEHCRRTGESVELDLEARLPGGGRAFHYLIITAARDASGQVARLVGKVQDITGRKLAEERLRQALAEREALLREIHHRVKNNLQVMVSLVGMTGARVADPVARSALGALSARITGMSLIHSQLYAQERLDQVDMAAYIPELAKHHAKRHPGRQVDLLLDLEPLDLHVEKAVPCALILGEALANIFAHAFPGPTPGKAEVRLRKLPGDRALLLVRDTGPGLDPDGDEGLGLTLIRTLAEQLQADLRLSAGPGLELRLEFDASPPRARIPGA